MPRKEMMREKKCGNLTTLSNFNRTRLYEIKNEADEAETISLYWL